MSRRKKTNAASPPSPVAGSRPASAARDRDTSYRVADPPKPNRRLLAAATALLALWMGGLVLMALTYGAFRVAK
jgi:hypothetical protein